MKRLLAALTVTLILSTVALAQDSPTPTPAPDPLADAANDVTVDIESLPGLAGLGVVVALLSMLARRFGLPDGWGGYAAFIVGLFVFVAVKILPVDARDQLFEGARYAAEFLTVVLGGQVAHASAKYAGLDKLWKGGDRWIDDTPKWGPSDGNASDE